MSLTGAWAAPALAAAAATGAAFVSAGAAMQARQHGRALAMAMGASWRRPPSRNWKAAVIRIMETRVGRVLTGVTAAIAGFVLAGPPGALVSMGAAIAVPPMRRRAGEGRRAEALEAQLSEAVAGVAAALRAGFSLTQALRFAAAETEPPLAQALEEVVEREELGTSLDESLRLWEETSQSPDVRLTTSVLRLHHRVGGDVPVVLDDIVRTLRHRRSAARELNSLTAQARLSGTILGSLPIGFFLFMSVVSRHDMQVSFRSPVGLFSILLGLALDAGAFLWIRRLLAGGLR